jgi:6-methylsalicylate decarboxylase
MRKVVDVHRHLWPEPFLAALRARGEPPLLDGWTLRLADGAYELEPDAYGIERCLGELDRDGVGLAVVSCPPTLGIDDLPDGEATVLRDAYHEGVREAVSAAGGRLAALAMGRTADGFAGVCLGAPALADLDRVAPVLDELEQRRQFLFVHPALTSAAPDAPPWWQAAVEYSTQMQAAYASWLWRGVERWPDLRVVFAILAGGGPFQLERLRSRGFDVRRAQRPTLFFDIASYGNRALEYCLAALGAEALLFGSDAPILDPRPTLAAVRSFGQAVEHVVCHDNARGLLNGEVP